MTSPYREDEATLRARAEALRDELRELDRRMGEALQWGAARARAAEELRGLEAELAGRAAPPRRRLPVADALDRIEVASPCPASWDDMVGDARERFCGACSKTVYDLSAMRRDEASAFLEARLPAGEVCVRLFRRADGRVLSADCPVGARWRRRKRALAASLGGAAMAFAGAGLALAALGGRRALRAELGEATRVSVEAPPPPAAPPVAPPVDTSLRPDPRPRVTPERPRVTVGRLPARPLMGKPSSSGL